MRARYSAFRGRKGDLVKILWHDGMGMSLDLKRLKAGKFIWPSTGSGKAVQISAAQSGYLLEGIDGRNPRWTPRPAPSNKTMNGLFKEAEP